MSPFLNPPLAIADWIPVVATAVPTVLALANVYMMLQIRLAMSSMLVELEKRRAADREEIAKDLQGTRHMLRNEFTKALAILQEAANTAIDAIAKPLRDLEVQVGILRERISRPS